eukprot:2643326-Amphidinium_carterae.1
MVTCNQCSAATRLPDKSTFIKRHSGCVAVRSQQNKPSRLEKRAITMWAGAAYADVPVKWRRVLKELLLEGAS